MLAAFAATLGTLQAAGAANVGRVPNPYGDDEAVLAGDMVPADVDRFSAVLAEAASRGKSVRSLQLRSGGGIIAAGYGIANLVRRNGMSTSVPDGSTCASACFMVFAAGSTRRVSGSARIGVHGASDLNHADTPQARSATIDIAKAYRALGVPNAIIGQMVVTPPNEIVWLTREDLRAMGVTVLDHVEPLHASPPAALASLSQDALPVARLGQGSWEALAARADAMSAAQHGGVAVRSRGCDAAGACTEAVVYTEADGNPAVARTTVTAGGGVLARVFCSFNGVVARSCLDVDRGTVTQEVRAADGGWVASGP